MPQLDFDGANSKVSADKIQGQSGTTVAVETGHNISVGGINVVAVAPSTSGNVLTSTGSAWASSAAAGGAWSVKTSSTFSGASLLNITGLTKTTRILMTDVISSGSGLTLRIRTSTDGGSSYDSGGSDYEFIYSYAADNAVTPTGYTTSSDAIRGVSHSIPNNAGEPGLIDITIYDPSATTQTILKVDTLSRESGTLYYSVGWGVRTSAANVDAVSIFLSGGTFTGNYVALELN